jgi:hypothetical protein
MNPVQQVRDRQAFDAAWSDLLQRIAEESDALATPA